MIEIFISLVLIGVLLLFLHPYELLMPMTMEASLVILLVVAFLGYLVLFWKEQARDERDDLHRLHAGRWSFFAGSLVIAAGILFQNITHRVDPWLVSALVVMVFVKMIARLYSGSRK